MRKSVAGPAESGASEFQQEHESRSVKIYPSGGRVVVEIRHGSQVLPVELSTAAVETLIPGREQRLDDARNTARGAYIELWCDPLRDGKLYLTASRLGDGEEVWLGVLLPEADRDAFFLALITAAHASGGNG